MSAIDAAPGLANRLYCPILFKSAARLEQMTWSDFTADAAETAAALRNAQLASGADLVVNWFDTWSECEVLGATIVRDSRGNAVSYAPPRAIARPLALLKSELLPRLKEIATRLQGERRPGTLLAGVLTGPHTLAKRLSGAADMAPDSEDGSAAGEASEAVQVAAQWAIELLRSYGEIGLDLSIIAEEESGAGAFYRHHPTSLAPIINLSRYYRHPLIMLNRRLLADDIADVTIGGAPQIGTIRMIPEDLFTSPAQISTDQLKALLGGAAEGRSLMLSSWEVPVEAEPERLRELGVRLKGGSA
jgi:hypothetical protein